MARLFPDVSEEEEERLIEEARNMPVWKKVEQIVALTKASRENKIAELREIYPQASDRELELRLAAILYGPELIKEAFGWDPKD